MRSGSIGKYWSELNLIFDIFIETSDIKSIVVYNVLGRAVRDFEVQSNAFYDLKGLPRGMYLVGLNDKNNKTLKTVRLLKQ